MQLRLAAVGDVQRLVLLQHVQHLEVRLLGLLLHGDAVGQGAAVLLQSVQLALQAGVLGVCVPQSGDQVRVRVGAVLWGGERGS